MAASKGTIPLHVQQRQKKVCNPREDHPIIAVLNEIEDSRKPSLTFKFPLVSILFMTLIAVICGATDWAKVVVIAMPQLMDTLDLKGTIITADAMNTQKATVKKAIEKQADYVLPVKGNQPTLLKDIQLAFEGLDDDLAKGRARWESEIKKSKENRDEIRLKKLIEKGPSTYKSTEQKSEIEKGHGRIESRTCTSMPIDDLPSKEGWEGIQSIVRVFRERTENGKTSSEITYYISSLEPLANIIAELN